MSKKASDPSLAKDNNSQVSVPTTEEIAALAYSFWEQEGRPEGRDVEHWQAAEKKLYLARGDDAPPQ